MDNRRFGAGEVKVDCTLTFRKNLATINVEHMITRVILTQNIIGVGKKGDIIAVRKGHARNFLIPLRLARVADDKCVALAETEKAAVEKRREEKIKGLKDIKQRLSKKRITLLIPANDQGTLYRGVASIDITDSLYTTYGVDINASCILMETIKTVGLHSFKVVLKDYGEIPMKARVKALQ